MKAIADRPGVSAPDAFYNCFKKETGMSPSSVKKRTHT